MGELLKLSVFRRPISSSLEPLPCGDWKERHLCWSLADNWVRTPDQTDHRFPFGTAVKSDIIASCWGSKEDSPYCSFVRENFNWMVDSYRMKWRPAEPNQGQLVTEVPDKMIAWASEAGKT